MNQIHNHLEQLHLGDADHEHSPTTAVSASKRPGASTASKTEIVLRRLRSARGASVADVMKLTGWQAHSVRGFLSATVRKKLALQLVSEPGKDGVRRYRITAAEQPGQNS
ncbi:DUF3489 domain-containing protein [Tianweitania sediminis]|uniref:DUF3489 domain-containing protein n=1 Tax=Tianweitania sediminis TaxID=1502156 RepID=A0A8J7RAA3_9HYPH|nr:DUF3489 domain-containing protein [Tianweitania sediminis]MBP0441282.1 DUF3489 domain-containing protein [Tianweitania sediminis]